MTEVNPYDAMYSRPAADRRWATLMAKWQENRFGENVQQFLGRWAPDNEFPLTNPVNDSELTHKWLEDNFGRDVQQFVGPYHPDHPEKSLTDRDEPTTKDSQGNVTNPNGISDTEYAPKASHAAAQARGQQLEPQFHENQPYNARQGEASTTEGDLTRLLVEKVGFGVAWAFDKIGLESISNVIHRQTTSDRIQNRKILARNLLSRWRDQGAAGALLAGSALRSSPIGQVGAFGQRGKDAASNFTTAGFQDPIHNYNVDGWDRDYKLRFYEAMGVGEGGSGMVYKPDWQTISRSAQYQSNLGQVKPFSDTGKMMWGWGGHLRGAAGWEDVGGDNNVIENWLNKIFAPPPVQPGGRLSTLQSELVNMQRTFMKNIGPGPRIPIPFRVAVNLADLLQQNILIPPEINRRNMATEFAATYNFTGDAGEALAKKDTFTPQELTTDPTDRVFEQLYTQNANPIAPTGMHENPDGTQSPAEKKRNPAGSIAGIPVADLQSPLLDKARGLYAPNDDYPVWRFEEDYKKNNLDNIQRGFNDNTPSNTVEKGLGSAVKNDYIEPLDKNQFVKTDVLAQQQSFPFMFETVNKRGSKRSYKVEDKYLEDDNGIPLTDADGKPIKIGLTTKADTGGKEYKQYAFFQATLNSISESYNPTWSSKHFFGRTEQIHSYTMTDRTLEVSFSITVDEIRKLQHLYERVLWLAQQTYASYDENGRMKAGPIIKMTIGDMFSGMTGFLRSLSYDWNYLGGGSPKWEITQGLRIPMACNVSLSFTILHDVMPDRNHNFYPGPMIAEKGIYSTRGATQFEPFATEGVGPLITEADYMETKANRGGPSEVNLPNARNQMFIDQAMNNAWDVVTGALEFQ